MFAADHDGAGRALRLRDDARRHRPADDLRGRLDVYNQRRSREKPRAGRTSAITAAYSVSEPLSLSNMTASTMKLPTNVPCQNASTPSSRRLLRITSISAAPMTAPNAVPEPPLRLAPPMTAAAMT